MIMSNLNKWIILHNGIPCCMRNGIMPIFMLKLENIHTFRSIYCCDISFICYLFYIFQYPMRKINICSFLSIFYNLIVMKLTNNSVIYLYKIFMQWKAVFLQISGKLFICSYAWVVCNFKI